MAKSATFAIINIGDELLLGLRDNSHLTFFGRELAAHGGELIDCQVVRDRPQEIVEALRRAVGMCDVVLVTGGLGPTGDDLTREAVAELFDHKLVFDEEIEREISKRFERLGRTMSKNNLRQCYRPVQASVLRNEWGTAPGLFLEEHGTLIFLLPGPTRELQPMFAERVLPVLREKGVLSGHVGFLQLRTCCLGESVVETRLQSIIDRHPNILFSFCAHGGIVDVRLSARRREVPTAEVNRVGEECRLLLGEDFFGFGEDSLAKIIVLQLRCWDRTLATAESCTGGLLASAFTDIPGASKVFCGGVISYTDTSKILMLDIPEAIILQHGAVSSETAVAMATGAAERFSSDYALSVTGFAGPDGGNEDNPVGTIHMAHFSPSGVWSRKVILPGERTAVKARAVTEALDWCRRTINRYSLQDFLVSGE